jgi:TonB family protein
VSVRDRRRVAAALVAAGMVVGIALAIGGAAWAQGENGKFVAADVATAGEIAYPRSAAQGGLVSLLVRLDESGAAQDWQVVQDVPPLTAAAQAGVQTWMFQAAMAHGKNVAAYFPVQVVFNPYNPGGTAVTAGGPKVPPAVPSNLGHFMPPQVRRASYAIYPENSQAQGTVVLSVGISQAGHVGNIKVVHGVAALNRAAMDAVKQWGFQPAMSDGQTREGRMCVAFVFQRNLS